MNNAARLIRTGTRGLRLTRMVVLAVAALLPLLAAICCTATNMKGSHPVTIKQIESESARHYVSEFYTWYTPIADNDSASPPWSAILAQSKFRFAPQLARLLRRDISAKRHCKELVGLDFDPFLNTQDPESTYVVGNVIHTGEIFRAEVYAGKSKMQGSRPSVIAVLTREKDSWIFADFDYPNIHTSLVSFLDGSDLTCSSRSILRPRSQ